VPSALRTRLSAAAHLVVDVAGSAWAAAGAAAVAVAWLLVGLIAGFSERWMSILFAATSLFTFVMVFFIQHATGRQFRALMIKLDELIRATQGARDELIAAEQRPLEVQEELEHAVWGEAPR